jgi:hypothetical protein
VIIVLAVRPPLGPLLLIIITAKFLPDHRVEHIKKAEEKTAQMGEMCDAAPCSLHGGEEFDEAENDHKVFSRDGEEKVDIDESVWEKPTEGEKDSIDGPGGTNYGNELIWSKNNSTNSCSDSAEEEIKKESLGSPVVFQFSTEHPEGQEVEENMRKSPMKKHVSEELP